MPSVSSDICQINFLSLVFPVKFRFSAAQGSNWTRILLVIFPHYSDWGNQLSGCWENLWITGSAAVCRRSLLADGSSYIITKFSAHKSLRSGKLYFYDDFLLLGMHFNTQANIKLAVFSPRKIYECHGSPGLMRDARSSVGDPRGFSLWQKLS